MSEETKEFSQEEIEKNNKGKEFKVYPLGNRVILKLERKDHITKSGIIIPAAESFVDKDKVLKEADIPKAEIIAIGPECKQPVKVGDIVTFEPQMVKEIWHPGNEYKKVQHFVTHELNLETVIR